MDPLEAFESNSNTDVVNSGEVDPAADFLAREQEELAKIESNDLSAFSEPVQQTSTAFEQDAVLVDNQQDEEQQQAANDGDVYSAITSADRLSQEPEKIKKWREEQRKRIEDKDAEEEVKKREWKEAAKKELDEWHKKRAEQVAKNHENNKVAEAELYAPVEPSKAVDFERVAKHCDFNPKANKNARDVGRMRSILLQLKQQPLVR